MLSLDELKLAVTAYRSAGVALRQELEPDVEALYAARLVLAGQVLTAAGCGVLLADLVLERQMLELVDQLRALRLVVPAWVWPARAEVGYRVALALRPVRVPVWQLALPA
jgi:hypothetical protein